MRGVIKCPNCNKHFDKQSQLLIHCNRNCECGSVYFKKDNEKYNPKKRIRTRGRDAYE